MPSTEHQNQHDKWSTKAQYSSHDPPNANPPRVTNSQISNAFERNLRRLEQESAIKRYRLDKDGPMSEQLIQATGKRKTKRYKERSIIRTSPNVWLLNIKLETWVAGKLMADMQTGGRQVAESKEILCARRQGSSVGAGGTFSYIQRFCR